jgi:CubicO group peptidase (beta-lactamase class C family)
MKRVLLLLALLVAWQPAAAQTRAEPPEASPADALFAGITPQTPGLVVLVAKGDKVIFQRAAGGADLEQGTPLRPDTRFHLASVSKQFTAAAVLLLAKDGKLRLDDRVRQHLPELPAAYDAITLAQLLNHTSGLRDQWDLVSASGASMADLLEQQRLFALVKAQSGLNFTPGSAFRYSNAGYLLAALTVERVSGQPFATFVEERMFKPLGMTSSLIYTDAGAIVPGRAQSYTPAAPFRNARLNYSNYGATSMFSTAGELLIWARELLHPRVLDSALVNAMAGATTLSDGTVSNYGMGLWLENVRGKAAIMHRGSDAGFRTLVAVHPGEDATIIILSNGSADVSPLHEALVEALLQGEPDTAEALQPSDAVLGALAGYYVSDWGPGMTLTFNGKALERQIAGTPAQAGRFFADGTFRFVAPEMRLRSGPNGTVLQENRYGPPVIFRRVASAPLPPPSLADFAGRYRSDELDQTLDFAIVEGQLQFSSMRQPQPTALVAVETDTFDFSVGRIHFARDEAGLVESATLQLGRTRGLRFRRLP